MGALRLGPAPTSQAVEVDDFFAEARLYPDQKA